MGTKCSSRAGTDTRFTGAAMPDAGQRLSVSSVSGISLRGSTSAVSVSPGPMSEPGTSTCAAAFPPGTATSGSGPLASDSERNASTPSRYAMTRRRGAGQVDGRETSLVA